MAHPSARSRAADTRGRVLGLLRRGPATVESLAEHIGVTDNAVRLHLTALERDGLVRAIGVRRGGPGKPATVFGIVDGLDVLVSRAHAPLLRALIAELRDKLDARELAAVLRRAGRRAGRDAARPQGQLLARAQGAVRALESLGAQVRLESGGDGVRIVSDGCIVGSIVSQHPYTCGAVAGYVGEVAGADATVECDRSGEPRCRFRLTEPGRR
ncbi:MAG: helix-turn-helix transcriptional regulator [Gemmatimonadaceae bacterium]